MFLSAVKTKHIFFFQVDRLNHFEKGRFCILDKKILLLLSSFIKRKINFHIVIDS